MDRLRGDGIAHAAVDNPNIYLLNQRHKKALIMVHHLIKTQPEGVSLKSLTEKIEMTHPSA